MYIKLILIAFVVAGLTSCTTVYKIGQTPDDVYFSPAPEQNVYVSTNNDENKYYGNRDSYANRDSYDDYYNDREIRRRINNRRFRRYDIDYGYNYPFGYDNNYPYSYYPYGYGNNYSYGYYPYGYSSPWIYVDPKTGKSPSNYNKPRRSNLGAYRNSSAINNSSNNTYNSKSNYPGIRTSPVRTFEKPRATTGTKVGNTIRRVFSNPGINTNSNIYRNDNTNSPSRSFEPVRSTPSSSRPSPSINTQSSGNAPVRKFK